MNIRGFLVVLLLWLAPAHAAFSHALEPGFLDLKQRSETVWQVFWRVPDVAGSPMAISVEFPETCTQSATPRQIFDGSAWIAAWGVSCQGGLVGKPIAIPDLDRQRTDVLVRLQMSDGSAETHRLTPKETWFLVPAQLSGLSMFISYLGLGFEHILAGWDHLLFVFALLVLIKDLRRLVIAITAFTVAHSITLALVALGHVSVPGPPVEAVIALSIVFLAVEIIKRQATRESLFERAPWLISFAFGLLHGLGFAGALREIGLPNADVATALLAFNLGVEAGQLLFVAVVLVFGLALARLWPFLRQLWRQPGNVFNTSLGYLVGCVATFWVAERLSAF